MEIIVRSKRLAKDFASDVPWAAISISTYGDWPTLNKCQQIDLLQLSFADSDCIQFITEHNQNESFPSIRLFNEEDANQILTFVEKIKDKVEILLVHCEAGISRSPAAAGALSLIYNNTDQEFFCLPFHPNMKVYNTILKKAVEIGLK